jgi:hypothetical protein
VQLGRNAQLELSAEVARRLNAFVHAQSDLTRNGKAQWPRRRGSDDREAQALEHGPAI